MNNRSDSALVALRKILRATEFNARNLARASGLTPSQAMAMQFVRNRGEVTPTEIAAHTSLKQATITALLDRLEERKLIRRRKDDADGRRMIVTLTTAGSEALDASPDSLQLRFQDRFGRLDVWEQASIVAALERIVWLLDAERIDAGPVLDIGALDEPLAKPGENT
jgi:DNA-binding MarR family transcriptional regulator